MKTENIDDCGKRAFSHSSWKWRARICQILLTLAVDSKSQVNATRVSYDCDSTAKKDATCPSTRKYGHCKTDIARDRAEGGHKKGVQTFVTQSEKRYLASTITSKNAKWIAPRVDNTGVIVAKCVICYLGMQFGGVRSTSQVANSFIGTGRVAGAVTFVRSAIFGPGGPRTHATPTFRRVSRLADDYQWPWRARLNTGGFADYFGFDRGATFVRALSNGMRIAGILSRNVPRHLVNSIIT